MYNGDTMGIEIGGTIMIIPFYTSVRNIIYPIYMDNCGNIMNISSIYTIIAYNDSYISRIIEYSIISGS